MVSDAVAGLLLQVGRSWPADWQLPGLGEVPAGHPLSGEIGELREERWGSLPYFSHSRIHWITMAPSSYGLRTAISTLRSWILPSYGWEHPGGSILPPANADPSLAGLLQQISPGGYFRWLSPTPRCPQVIKKLGEMRALEQHRPPYADVRQSTLFELRHEFHLALVTGDRDSAQQVISQIDKRQLDTAVNTQFMRIRMHDQFREFASIVDFERLDDLLQMRMPGVIRNAVVRAFYWHFISPTDSKEQAEQVYDTAVHPRLAGLLCSCRKEDGPEVEALLRYQARYAATPTVELALSEQFADAMRRSDWRAMQRVGTAILLSAKQDISIDRQQLRDLLAKSLEHYASDEVRQVLVATAVPEVILPFENWPQFVLGLRQERWQQCQMFLDLPDRPQLKSSDVQQTEGFALAVTELFTEEHSSIAQAFVYRALSVIAEDVIADPEFPVSGLLLAYEVLFQVWAAQFRGSQKIQHRAVLLSLGQALLEEDAKHEGLIHDAIRGWWQARRTATMLPFLGDGLELLASSCSLSSEVQALWYDAAEVILASHLPRGEVESWRAIARRSGLDQKDVDAYLPLPELGTEEAEDPLQGSGLRRIAIVSLHERQARTAGEIIRKRTGAEVVIDDELTPGEQTELAKRSDLILFVWAAAKHAVFRAFDSVREKVVYIQGSGAASILRALERWAVERRP